MSLLFVCHRPASHNALGADGCDPGLQMDGLCSLRGLDLSHNRLSTLPASLSGATSLTRLDASCNALVSMPAPEMWDACTQLTEVNVR